MFRHQVYADVTAYSITISQLKEFITRVDDQRHQCSVPVYWKLKTPPLLVIVALSCDIDFM